MIQKQFRQKKLQGKSILDEMQKIAEKSEYLIDIAKEVHSFKSQEEIDDWYTEACFVKRMLPEMNDQELMPEKLKIIIANIHNYKSL